MEYLQNDLLKIAVNPIGAELSSISNFQNLEFMWSGNADVWHGISPVLFPIVGGLKDDTFIFEEKSYSLLRHGFTRRNPDVKLHERDANKLTFILESSEATKAYYPFDFEFLVSYELLDNSIQITYHVKNKGSQAMYFSFGAHPAFKCPVFEGERYENYFLEFDRAETSQRHLLSAAGLLNLETEPVFSTPTTIALSENLFKKDALVFKDLNSESIALVSHTYGEILKVRFTGWPYMGLWAKPKAPFVCIEPWMGIADSDHTNQQLTDKEGIIKLDVHQECQASYFIEINTQHLKSF